MTEKLFDKNAVFYGLNTDRQIWKAGDGYSFIGRGRHANAFCYIISGRIDYRFADGKTLTATAGDIVFLPEKSEYKATFTLATDDVLVNFHTGCIAETVPNSTINKKYDLLPVGTGKTKPYIVTSAVTEDLKSAFLAVNADGALAGDYKKMSAFYAVLDGLFERTNGDRLSYEAEKLIYSEEIFILDERSAADRLNVSVSTLQRYFVKRYQKSFSDFRSALRIEKAKKYLSGGYYTVLQIAEKLNFYDSAYFCKAFKKATGFTPKEYARAHKFA
ncbi:MAG TPA: hypothetical protein DHU65_01070 [Clostridiales bacterium]|nr:hypothetical protein [Clostridiales bacterium]